ncbi:MAG: hypothetical protein M1833_000318 [Piccolia ochrophora]|nr:MAG: hypothetical protein M1833_000318 [Piccolia ochrophora]
MSDGIDTSEAQGNFPLDAAVISKLPQGSKLIRSDIHGASAWAQSAKVSIVLQDGKPKTFFLKYVTGGNGASMMEGEFNALSELYKTFPSFITEPWAWGKFEHSVQPTHFFLMEFIPIADQLPLPGPFCALVAQLHRTSESPTGKFRLHIPTCHGKLTQNVDWESSWAKFFQTFLTEYFRLDNEVNGPWRDYDEAKEHVLSYVIPRLLEPLQAEGRTLKPCLVHGDLWEENTATTFDGDIKIFDSAAIYAHNEFEIGMWRCERLKFSSRAYTGQYLKEIRASEPREDWDDRNRLYSLKFNLCHAIHFPGSPIRDVYVPHGPTIALIQV